MKKQIRFSDKYGRPKFHSRYVLKLFNGTTVFIQQFFGKYYVSIQVSEFETFAGFEKFVKILVENSTSHNVSRIHLFTDLIVKI